MPKWDKTRNYYADLEVPPSATPDEIKRQFKKLALKYHPDRNPGREAEVNPKFQVIQSAHEILSDDTQKRQYDEARRSYTARYPTAAGVRGNPWQDAAKAYPPPPRRQPNTQTRPKSGAHRYEDFGAAMPQHAQPQTPKDDPQFRRTNAEAWDHLRASASRKTYQARPTTPGRAPPGRAPTSAARDARPGPAPTPRTAYQKQKAEAAFGTNKKTGFAPGTPGIADEPPVTNKNYFTNRTHSNLFTEPEIIPEASFHDAGADASGDPFAGLNEQFAETRRRTPYHTPGGEKTSLFDHSPGLGRSTSTRTPPRSFPVPGAFPRTRPRSSSPPRGSSNDGGSEDSTKVGPSTSGGTDHDNMGAPSKAGERYKPKGPTVTDIPPQPATTSQFMSSSTAPQPNASGSSFFNFPSGPTSTSPKTFTRNSTENINTRFVEHEMVDDWEFKAGSASANEATTPSRPRPQSRNRPARRQTPLSKPTLPNRVSQAQEVPTETNGSKSGFSARAWSEQIGPQHFEPQPTTSASTSPTRRAHLRKSKSCKMTAGTAAVVDEEESEEWQEVHRPFQSPDPGRTSIAPDAMDIDTPPVEVTEEIPRPVNPHSARKYSTEPHRPDWRAGDVNGVTSQATAPTFIPDKAKEMPSLANGAQQTMGGTKPSHSSGGSEDTEEFFATFSDLKNVEPFVAPLPSGLKSFADLKSTLPFPSQPSEQIPLDMKPPPLHLGFPPCPVAPRLPPPMAVAGLRPNKSSFRKYAQDFNSYMSRWEDFNEKILTHFQVRQNDYKLRSSQRGANWLEDVALDYLAELDQDLEVRKQYADACAEHRKRIAEFIEFRDRVK
ncbi:hypothetical protein SAMD00023353_0100060 [Rosellinia necatrix]|uniref:J domain-containing protein n=1 Tax=Rosellinia necatrix TaxID=77044 RepID=A0A1S7UH61_ROSNE|nr:hypothetical protein SAMD00023353_0100060 [Rosellinia necatrix]